MMARKMRKFSAGGAQGKYDRRMADIEKDFKKDSAGKSGKALEVLAAKRAQRTADAEDDRAKRTGADRTATRAAEKAAEANLTKTRRYGADKPVAKAEPAKASTPEPAKTTAPEAAKAKPQSFAAAFKDARSRLGAGKTFTYNGKSFTTNIAGEGRKPVQKAAVRTDTGPVASSSSPSVSTPDVDNRAEFRRQTAMKQAELRREANRAAMRRNTAGKEQLVGPASAQEARIRAAQSATAGVKPVDDKAARLSRLKVAAEAPGATQFAKDRYKSAVSSGMYAKGGSVKKEKTMKYAKGGSTPSRPMPMGGKQLMPMKKKPVKEPITGGADTVPLTPGRKEFLKEMAKRNAKPGMAKGGSASCGMAKGGKATKFGAAMKKKSADTKGRAMMKFAKGGSIDGCATKGKTKGKMV